MVLVLEAGDATAIQPLQAFNLGGQPLRYFAKQPEPLLPDADGDARHDQGWTYLDMAVEFTGFIYVLSYNRTRFVYRLDIYHPSSRHRADRDHDRLNAAKLTVDFWRNVYTLNYEVLTLPEAGADRAVVSLWVPSESCTGVNCTPS